MNLMIRPLGRSRYAALLNDRVVAEGRTPLLSAARVLLAEGTAPETPLTMTHAGSSTVSIRTTVGAAAALMIEETDTRGPTFRKYREMPQGVRRQSPRTAIINQDDAECPQQETPFCDDHLREVGRTYP